MRRNSVGETGSALDYFVHARQSHRPSLWAHCALVTDGGNPNDARGSLGDFIGGWMLGQGG